MRDILTRNDKILIVALVGAALLSTVPVVTAFARREQGVRAVVLVAGRRAATVGLATDRTFVVRTKAGTESLRVDGGKIRVAGAPCPRKICKHNGWISRAGEELVCVPGEMIVRIEGGGPSRVDAVSR